MSAIVSTTTTNRMRCDLTSAPRRDANERGERLRAWMRWVAAYASIVTMVALGFVCCTVNSSEDAFNESAKIAHRADELDRSISVLRPQLTETQDRLIVAHTIGDQPDWSDLLTIVASQVSGGVVLTDVRLEAMANFPTATGLKTAASVVTPAKGDEREASVPLHLVIQGTAPGLGTVSQFVLRMEQLNLFERIDQQSGTHQSFNGGGELVGFKLDCPLRRSAASLVSKSNASASASANSLPGEVAK